MQSIKDIIKENKEKIEYRKNNLKMKEIERKNKIEARKLEKAKALLQSKGLLKNEDI
jgi:hypothetical protein